FRDVVLKLREKYDFDVKIPTCQQFLNNDLDEYNLKFKQLSTKQANETQMVTKCRFIVEKKIGKIKKFRALENVRNTAIDHMQIDYRIASAMINFSHISCSPDGNHGKKIARRMIRKSRITKNELKFLIGKHLETKLIASISISNIGQTSYVKQFKNTYKVFIKYIPGLNHSKSIQAHICTCLSGLRIVGCCSHVATNT
ncbi:hypothetical protein BpHYR1_026373, partial [Brachionus plicatilis]